MQAGESLKRDQRAGTGSTSADCSSEVCRLRGICLLSLCLFLSSQGLNTGRATGMQAGNNMQDKNRKGVNYSAWH